MIPADGGGDGFHVRKDAFADDHAVFEGLKILAGGGDGRVVTVDAEQLRFGEPFKKPSGVSAATDGGVDDPLGAMFGYQAYDLLKKNWGMAECHCVSVTLTLVSETDWIFQTALQKFAFSDRILMSQKCLWRKH